MGIGERLREERERLGLNQTDFAALAGAHRKSQANYESGERSPDAAYLAAIANAGGADVQYIVTGVRSDAALTPDERELLALFRAAPLTGKAAAVGALKGAAAAGNEQPGKYAGNKIGQIVQGDYTSRGGTSINIGGKKKK